MCSNHDCSYEKSQPLGLVLCFIVMAYIYYFTTATSRTPPLLERTRDAATPPVTEPQIEDMFTPDTKLLEAFEAGTRAYMLFDIQDIRRIKLQMEERNHESKEREKRLEKRLEEFENSRMEMERQMKRWREEQLKMLWGWKQKREGFGGWFRLGTPRVTEGVRDEGLKERRASEAQDNFDEKTG